MKKIIVYGVFYDDFGYESPLELQAAYISNELALKNIETIKNEINKKYGYFERRWDKQLFIKPIEVISE